MYQFIFNSKLKININKIKMWIHNFFNKQRTINNNHLNLIK